MVYGEIPRRLRRTVEAGALRLEDVHQVSGTGAELEYPGLAVHDLEAPLGGQQWRGMERIEAVELQLVPPPRRWA